MATSWRCRVAGLSLVVCAIAACGNSVHQRTHPGARSSSRASMRSLSIGELVQALGMYCATHIPSPIPRPSGSGFELCRSSVGLLSVDSLGNAAEVDAFFARDARAREHPRLIVYGPNWW